ncbi:ATP-binding cassette domain-containing protein [Sinosporangium siamense]|uniref:ABC transporter ATP-binding protein n=1 Tax=Sinosporangium siamense TaxID=1367973 RepID=A0A919RE07_9ACTN|nr:ABC transporter ATP-binding protein [Sinosporangium siamense]GII91692.1 ABC transporter ATP-binding protein [Sinosporangium siamense]
MSGGGGATRLLRFSYRTGRSHYLAILFWSVVEAAPVFVSGLAVARALDQGFLVGKPLTGLSWLGVFALAAGLGAVGLGQIVPRLGAVAEPLRDALVRKVVEATVHRACEAWGRPVDSAVVARLTQQVELVRDSFAGLIMVVRDFAFTTVAVVAGLLTLLPMSAPLIIGPVVISVALFARLMLSLAERQRDLVLADEHVAAEVGTVVAGVRDVVAAGAEATAAARAGRAVDDQAHAARGVAVLTSAGTLCMAVGGWLPVVLLLLAFRDLFAAGATTGEVLGTMIFVLYGVQPALRGLVVGLGGTGLRLAVTAARLLDTTDTPGTPPLSSGGRDLDVWDAGTRAEAPRTRRRDADEGASAENSDPPPPSSGRDPDGRGTAVDSDTSPSRGGQDLVEGAGVVVSGVTFAYGAEAEPVLDGLDLHIPGGDHLAVVGPSGIGKSTLAALIAGVLTPGAGRITVAGRPIAGHDPAAFTEWRVLIPQEAYVFTGTLADNLRYLRPAATPEMMERSAHAVGLDLPHGLSEPLVPGDLSAGRRQLVALARAHLSAARLVILDEATCHLDAAAEARAEEAMAARPGTLIVIAHRMSSALRAGRVLVLDGTSAAVGSHTDLLASSPLYRDLAGRWRG